MKAPIVADNLYLNFPIYRIDNSNQSFNNIFLYKIISLFSASNDIRRL